MRFGLPAARARPPPLPADALGRIGFDVIRGGQAVARVAVLDTSLKSLSAADAVQNPVEDQTAWLRSVLCRVGDSSPGAGSCVPC